jgi:hypothetical protein
VPISHADLLRRCFEEVWNQGSESAIDELLAPDGRIHGLGEAGVVAEGPAGFKPFWAQLCATFPTRRFEVEVTGMSFVRVGNGQLLEGWNNWDALEMATKISALRTIKPLAPTA